MAIDASQINEHMEVLSSDGEHVGTVDRVEGQRLKLTKGDSASGKHQYIDMGMVDAIEDGAVCLSVTAAEAKAEQQT